MSQISPLVMRGMLVRDDVGHERGVTGPGWSPGTGAVTVTDCVVWLLVVPSLTVRVTVRVPALA